MPAEITLFTDNGQWAAVVTAWHANYGLYHDLGVRVRVFRLGVPPTWGSELGPWGKHKPLGGPWKAKGPWGAFGPWRADGPWAIHKVGPWGAALPRSWVETDIKSITIEAHYVDGHGVEVILTARGSSVSFLRLSQSGFGPSLVLQEGEKKVTVSHVRGDVVITLPDGSVLRGQVTTGRE